MGRDAHERQKKPEKFKLSGARIWLPLNMLQGRAYSMLSPTAKALLTDLAAQLRATNGNIYNNGDLTTAISVLHKRGWKSDKTIRTAAKQLEEAKLIVKTRQGRLPNKANLYAVTWLPLNEMNKLDISAKNFPLNGFLLLDPPPAIKEERIKN